MWQFMSALSSVASSVAHQRNSCKLQSSQHPVNLQLLFIYISGRTRVPQARAYVIVYLSSSPSSSLFGGRILNPGSVPPL